VSALIYPAVLVLVAIGSILMLLGYVVPQFTEMFAEFDQALPLSTKITVAVGEAIRSYGWILLLLIPAGAWFVRRQLANRRSARRWHAWLLRLPMIGDIAVKMEDARFAHTLSTLLDNGVPLLAALSIVKDATANYVIADGLEGVVTNLKDGSSLAEPLAAIPYFPAFAVQMIRVGEESGELQSILTDVSAAYERETQLTIKRSLALLEPVLILVLGAVIAAVIMSVLVAILGINELVI
jgi:general secretion pathway protein F